MSRIPMLCLLPLAGLAMPAAAQEQAPERTINVSGSGVVRTPPDTALLEFWLRGEGTTSDAATQALSTRQRAVVDGLSRLLGREAEVATGPVTVIEVRGSQCQDARGYGSQPRLSEGACAVIGFLATVQGSARTSAVDRAGTAAGLAARLGASDARLQSFTLADPTEAARRATAAALRDAQGRAEAIAAGAGVRLGPITAVRDNNYGAGDLVLNARALSAPPPPPPPAPMAAPVALDTRPRPIETRAQVQVTYAILP